jgi:hypothetical protein
MTSGQLPTDPKIDEMARGDILSIARDKIKNPTKESCEQVILYLHELEKRGLSKNDWEEYRVIRALAFCYSKVGNNTKSMEYWNNLSAYDTSKCIGERPKSITPQGEILYNKIGTFQKLAFNERNRSNLDSLSIWVSMVDSLYKVEPNSPEMASLLFNKTLFLWVGGKKELAKLTVEKLKKEYPYFKYKGLDDLLPEMGLKETTK